MSKAVINNEIIILRKFVEQARVHIIKKLSRDVTKYKNKKGTDAQKAKNERKSNRLAAEILSIKKVRKDEITKHILTNNINLKQVLENQVSTPLNRAMARIAHHKIFSKKIAEFKSKYPNYMEFMGPGRKKKATLEWKEKKKMKSDEYIEKIVATGENDEDLEMLYSDDYGDKIKSTPDVNSDKRSNNEEDSEEENKIDLSERKNGRIHDKCYKNSEVRMEKLKLMETNKRNEDNDKHDKCYLKKNDIKKRNNVPKIISKQAIVTKLADILQGDNCSKEYEKEVNIKPTNSIVEKEVDLFFMTDDERSYLSIAVPKVKMTSVQDDFMNNKGMEYKNKNFLRQHNDKFFSKVVNLKKSYSKFTSQWEDKKLYQNQSNANRWEVENKRTFHSIGSSSNNSKTIAEKAKFIKSGRNTALNYENIEHLHPSWEAKKKEQEKLKKGFQGKKIIFGDNV